MVKNLPANVGDTEDTAWIPGLRRSPEGGNGNPLQYSCLENPTDRGTWWATVHGIRKSHTTEYGMTHNMYDTYYITCESILATKAENQAVSESFY